MQKGLLQGKRSRYELSDQPIGRGGFAYVYKEKSDETIAIKKLRNENGSNGLRHERNMLGCVRGHCNVMALIDHGDDWYAMEYVSCNLEQVLASQIGGVSTLSRAGQVKGYFIQILRGVEYCHSKNIIHRDLKPLNILVTNECVVKIADFGLAGKLDADGMRERTDNGCIYATSWYRAPELLLYFRLYGPAVDIWSVGCIFGEMLFGGQAIFPCYEEDEAKQMNVVWSRRGTPDIDSFDDEADAYLVQMSIHQPLPLTTMRKLFSKPVNQSKHVDMFVPHALDLLESALHPNPKFRATATQLLQMDYLAKDSPAPFTTAQLCHARKYTK